MATGTEGLGLPTTVFDFSGIAEKGKEMDDALMMRRERWAKDNAFLYDTPDTTLIRDIDSPYINEQAELAMQLNAKAVQTKRPEDIQAAKNQMATTSRLVTESRVGRVSMENAKKDRSNQDAYLQNPQMYDEDMRNYEQRTAMNAENKGNVGQGIVYQNPNAYNEPTENVEHFVDKSVNEIIKQAEDSYSNSQTSVTGVKKAYSWEALNEDFKREQIALYYDQEVLQRNNTKLDTALTWKVMENFFGRIPNDNDVAYFNSIMKNGDQLHQQFESIEDLREAYKNSPAQLQRLEQSWGMEQFVIDEKKRIYVDQVTMKAQRQKKEAVVTDEYVSGSGSAGGAKDDYGLDATPPQTIENGQSTQQFTSLTGYDWTVFGSNKDGEPNYSRMNTEFKNLWNSEGTRSGYVSRNKSAQAVTGSGTNRRVVDGIIYLRDANDNVTEWALTWTISPEVDQKIKQAKAAGEDWSRYLDKTDGNLVPLDEVEGDVGRKELNVMKGLAMQQVGLGGEQTQQTPTQVGQAKVTGNAGAKYN